MTDEWLNQMEGFSTRGDRLIDEIEAELSRFGGDILDNGLKGSGRYMSNHLKDLVVRWAGGAMAHERAECAKVCDERSRWIADVIVPGLSPEFRGADSFANGSWQEAEMCAAAIRARSGE